MKSDHGEGAQTASLLWEAGADLGEGALWDGRQQVLLWVDINRKEVHRYDPATGRDRKIVLDRKVGTVVPRRSGGLVVALEDRLCALNPDAGGPGHPVLTVLAAPEPDPGADPAQLRFNDGKCDPRGRFWVGTMGEGAALYCLDTDGTCTRKLGGIRCSNGIAWNKARDTMYYIDSPTREIWAFPYDDGTGALGEKRVIVQVPEGYGVADGATLDAEGMLWAAHWGGSRVCRWNPDTGALLREIHVPAAHVTSCAFGGENLETLYITTARAGLSEEELREQPLAGALFQVKPGVRGIPAYAYGG